MKEVGVIHQIIGKTAKVTILRHAACGDCGACHVGKEKMTMETVAKNPIGAKSGEKVEVEMQFASVFKAAGIMYGIPFLAFIIGCSAVFYGISFWKLSWDPVLTPFFSGIFLTGLVYFCIKILDKKGKFNQKYQPTITAILPEEEAVSSN